MGWLGLAASTRSPAGLVLHRHRDHVLRVRPGHHAGPGRRPLGHPAPGDQRADRRPAGAGGAGAGRVHHSAGHAPRHAPQSGHGAEHALLRPDPPVHPGAHARPRNRRRPLGDAGRGHPGLGRRHGVLRQRRPGRRPPGLADDRAHAQAGASRRGGKERPRPGGLPGRLVDWAGRWARAPWRWCWASARRCSWASTWPPTWPGSAAARHRAAGAAPIGARRRSREGSRPLASRR